MSKVSAATSLASVMSRAQHTIVVDEDCVQEQDLFQHVWVRVARSKSEFVAKNASRAYRKKTLTFVDTPEKYITKALTALDSGRLDGGQTFYALRVARHELNRLNGLSKDSTTLSVAEALNRQRLHNLLLWYCDKNATKIRSFDNGRLISQYCKLARQLIDDHEPECAEITSKL